MLLQFLCLQDEDIAPENDFRQDALLSIRDEDDGQFKPISKLDSIINKRATITANVAVNVFKAALDGADDYNLSQSDKCALQKFHGRAVDNSTTASKRQAKLTKYFRAV